VTVLASPLRRDASDSALLVSGALGLLPVGPTRNSADIASAMREGAGAEVPRVVEPIRAEGGRRGLAEAHVPDVRRPARAHFVGVLPARSFVARAEGARGCRGSCDCFVLEAAPSMTGGRLRRFARRYDLHRSEAGGESERQGREEENTEDVHCWLSLLMTTIPKMKCSDARRSGACSCRTKRRHS
jgi:hypothetical protein